MAGKAIDPTGTGTEKHFGVALRDLLLARKDGRFLMPNNNLNWMVFVKKELEPRGVSYETLRKAISGERHPSATLIEKVAQALGIDAEYFAEYRLAQASRAFDVKEVGYEQALENLRLWDSATSSTQKVG